MKAEWIPVKENKVKSHANLIARLKQMSIYRLICIQLFRERLLEKVHATIPKGIVGGFEFTVLQKNRPFALRGNVTSLGYMVLPSKIS